MLTKPDTAAHSRVVAKAETAQQPLELQAPDHSTELLGTPSSAAEMKGPYILQYLFPLKLNNLD